MIKNWELSWTGSRPRTDTPIIFQYPMYCTEYPDKESLQIGDCQEGIGIIERNQKNIRVKWS